MGEVRRDGRFGKEEGKRIGVEKSPVECVSVTGGSDVPMGTGPSSVAPVSLLSLAQTGRGRGRLNTGCFSNVSCSTAPLLMQQANGGSKSASLVESLWLPWPQLPSWPTPQPTPACSGPLVALCHLPPHFLKPGLLLRRMPCW